MARNIKLLHQHRRTAVPSLIPKIILLNANFAAGAKHSKTLPLALSQHIGQYGDHPMCVVEAEIKTIMIGPRLVGADEMLCTPL